MLAWAKIIASVLALLRWFAETVSAEANKQAGRNEANLEAEKNSSARVDQANKAEEKVARSRINNTGVDEDDGFRRD